jgi:hypothetical protein
MTSTGLLSVRNRSDVIYVYEPQSVYVGYIHTLVQPGLTRECHIYHPINTVINILETKY